MTTYIIRIEPDGTVIRMDESVNDLLPLAEAALDTTLDVVTMHHNGFTPFPAGPEPYLVAAVAEWGRSQRLPLNVKAWALYGRSPIVGPCFIAFDKYDDAPGRPELPEAWIAKIEEPLDHWLDERMISIMKNLAKKENIPWA